MSPIKILWHSVAPWVGTGYGSQTGLFTPRIRDLGHDVAISAYYGLMGAEMSWKGMRVLPAYAAQYGVDVMVPHALSHFGAGRSDGEAFTEVAGRGVVITLGDVWCFQAPLLPDLCVAAWCPVDHEDLPPNVLKWFHQTGAVPIAMSRFGERKLAEAGLRPIYVPHGFDGSVFFPGDRAEARALSGLPADAFVVAMVAANIGKDGSRKAFSEQIRAFAELRRKHSDAMLALYTDVDSMHGVNIRLLVDDLPPNSVTWCDQYAYRCGPPSSVVADFLRAADVLTNTSWGEGFGIPIIEAQAVGTPVVVTDTTAMPELCGSGWVVSGEPFWHDSQRAWAKRPLIGGIVEAYERAYDTARSEEMRALAWAHVQPYEANTILTEQWKPALERLESALAARQADLAKPRKPAPPKVREADGLLWLDRGAGTGDALGAAGHEQELGPILTAELPEGGVLLDVGAHVGHWSLRMALRASRVYAVEANPATAAVLRRNIAINEISNVTVIERAAWDSQEMLALVDPHNQVGGGSTRTVPVAEGEPVAVFAAPLDDFPELADLDRLDLVKLDVEGADLHALRGMSGLLAQHHPTLLIECHDYCGYYERPDLESLLVELGYEWEVALTYLSRWRPDGPAAEPANADYLVCTPKGSR